MNGSYGISQEHHGIRLCKKRQYVDLNSHMRHHHGLLASIANVVSRAVHSKVPLNRQLFPNNVQVTDPHRSFLCPLSTDCGNHCWLPALSLKGHLIDVHRLSAETALNKVSQIVAINHDISISNIKAEALKAIRIIELENEYCNTHIVSHSAAEQTMQSLRFPALF